MEVDVLVDGSSSVSIVAATSFVGSLQVSSWEGMLVEVDVLVDGSPVEWSV